MQTIAGDGEQAHQDLELCKIELELKNEELRGAQAQLEALWEAQRRTSEILGSITDAVYVVDADWRLTYVNKKAEALWGRSQEDLVGRVLWSLFPRPEETKGYDEHLRAMAERTPVHFETFSPNLHSWVSVNIYPTADGGLAVYFRDITERKQAEEALRKSNERLHAALDASGGAIYDHRVPLDESTYHDDRWAEMLGYRHAELPPYDGFLDWLFEQVHAEDRELLERAYEDFVEGRVPCYDVQIRLRHKQGDWIWVEGYSHAVERDESGRVRRIVGMMSDITARKRLEEALATERESLELRVRERTEALLQVNEELRHEFAEREKAEAALLRSEKLAMAGKLAAGLAHEIKNPLQAVIGCAELAREALPAHEEVMAYLHMLIQEAHRIGALVDELRDLQRPVREEGRQPISVNEVVERPLALNAWRASEQGVAVEWQPADDLPLVWGLRMRLQQVVLNLLLNAFDVMPEGGQLHARSQADRDGKGVWLHISDSGPGIPEDVLPHIFEPFYSTREEGQGLGLFICHNIVAEHEGRIEVDTRLGEGTTFSVWLPAAQAE